MLSDLDNYDWEQAFVFAGGDNGTEGGASARPFTREDVVRLFFLDPGENDRQPWRCAGRLKDKRYFYLEAGCDYTGWDCHASGWAKVAVKRNVFLAMCVPEVVRERVKAGMAKRTRRSKA